MIEALFGLEMSETLVFFNFLVNYSYFPHILFSLTCNETEMETPITKIEHAQKLVCNITIETNHVSEGIKIVITLYLLVFL
jgi:hypothetical protein